MAMFRVALEFAGMGETNYIVTDGRFSGYTEGTAIGYLAPEAAVGGTIALVRDGDIIEIDIEKRSSSRVVQRRRRGQWRRSAEP
jgi:dihydroxy-acid dehydratase